MMKMMKTFKQGAFLRMLFATCLICLLLLAHAFIIMATKAASPYHATFSTSNFTLQTVEAGAEDMSDPSHVTFHLQNGSPFWYGITLQSTPSGITPVPANQSDDIVTTTFLGSMMLLPPAGILPFDRTNGSYSYETLRLMLAFSGPNQQVQLTLNPYDTHAATLDVLTLILQLIGQRDGMTQMGLLAPGGLQAVFNAVNTMQDFSSLTGDYLQLLQSSANSASSTNTTGTSSTDTSLSQAYTCAKDLVALLTNQSEQLLLGNLLWNLLGKAIARASILSTLASFSSAQFGLGIEGFLKDEVQAIGSSFLQSGNPTVLIQTISNIAPTATPVPAQTPVLTKTPLPQITPTLRPSSTASATP